MDTELSDTHNIASPLSPRSPNTHSVVIDDIVRLSPVQHLAVPLHQPLGLGDLHLWRVAVEDVIVAFTRRTRPDVSRHEP